MSDSEEELSFESAGDGNEENSSDVVHTDDLHEISDLEIANKEKENAAASAMSEPAVSSKEPTSLPDVASTKQQTSSDDSAGIPQDKTKVVASSEPGRALDKLVDDQSSSGWGWGSFSSWGSSVLNTAATSVGTFTSHVGEGLHQVLDTVESGLLGDDDESSEQPDSAGPETVVNQEMVRHDVSQSSDDVPCTDASAEAAANPESTDTHDSWLTGWKLPVLTDVVNKTSSVVQQTVQQTSSVSKKVIGGGIDVLEAIGRKTYDVLAEGDHGLKKTLEKSRENQTTLSQTLREAKMQAESRELEEEVLLETRKCSFGAQFDDFQGLVQLEALESLNGTSERKVRRFVEMLPKYAADSLKTDLKSIRVVFDSVEADSDDDDVTEQDFAQLINDYFDRLNLNASVQKLLTCQSKVRQVCCNIESSLQQHDGADHTTSTKEIHQAAIKSLAELTACAIEHWHRVGQQLILTQLSPQTLRDVTTQLAVIVKVLCCEISLTSAAFVNCLTLKQTQVDDAESTANNQITAVYLESSNASDYIRKGFMLLLPVLQLAIIRAHPLFTDTDD